MKSGAKTNLKSEISKVEMKRRRAIKRIITKTMRRDEKAFLKQLMMFDRVLKFEV